MILMGEAQSSTMRQYMNGMFRNENTTGYTPNASRNLRVGAGATEYDPPQFYYDGEIYELIIFSDSLLPEERYKINYYLSRKWGLEAFVDSDDDGLLDEVEESLGSSPIDPTELPSFDLSDSVDAQIGISSSVDTIEGTLSYGSMQQMLIRYLI